MLDLEALNAAFWMTMMESPIVWFLLRMDKKNQVEQS